MSSRASSRSSEKRNNLALLLGITPDEADCMLEAGADPAGITGVIDASLDTARHLDKLNETVDCEVARQMDIIRKEIRK